ncbi:MAG: replication and repair protein RecF [Verrucomicrobiota bacterium]|jgi:DNA replication and repair protein RecF
MLAELRLQNFRCFDALAVTFAPGFNFFLGANGEGKTSILEAACVLLRLQSQRSSSLAPLVQIGHKSFAVAGRHGEHSLAFRYSALRRKLSFDHVDQTSAAEYLRIARVVSFANTDIELARGGSEPRRRYLDFLGSQIDPSYRPTLRAYERALRSRNALLKAPQPRPREIAAYALPLLQHGTKLSSMRATLVERLTPFAIAAHAGIGDEEKIDIKFIPGSGADFEKELAESSAEELRLRQTIVGPHRDDLELRVQQMPAAVYASEGQQRTIALALKIAQAQVFATEETSPLLLIDDIFGELDPDRRNALLRHLPGDAQKLVTATALQWREDEFDGPISRLEAGKLRRA